MDNNEQTGHIDRRAFLARSGGIAVGLVGLPAILAACGGSDAATSGTASNTAGSGTSSQAAGSTGASSATATASAEMKALSFQLSWLPNAQASGEYVALEKGFYKDAGLDLAIQPGGPDVAGISLLAANNVNVAVSYQANTILARAQGVPVQAFAATLQRAPLTYYSLERYGITSIADFAGKSVGVTPDGEPFLRAFLEANGMSIDDVTIQRAGASVSVALLEHQVDVVAAWDINVGQIGPILAEDDVVSFSLYDNGLKQQSNVYLATTETIDKETEMLAALVTASSRGWEYAADNPQEAIEIVTKLSQAELDPTSEVAGLEKAAGYVFDSYTASDGWGALDEQVWSDAISLFDQYGMLDGPVDVGTTITTKVLDAAPDRVKRG